MLYTFKRIWKINRPGTQCTNDLVGRVSLHDSEQGLEKGTTQNWNNYFEHNLEITREHNLEIIREHNLEITREHNLEITREHNLEITLEHNLEITREHNLEITLEHNLEITRSLA